MASAPLPIPGFGQADLSNCEREQIHLAGSIQPHGALLVVREPDQTIIQASANAAAFLGIAGELLGRPLAGLAGDLAARIRPFLKDPLHAMPKAVRCQIGEPAAEYDGLLHRPPQGGLVIELERAGPAIDLSRHVKEGLRAILAAATLRALCDEAAQIFRSLAGYDRVMVYRFDEMGHGEILSEERQPELEPYLGNRYPASDIPQIARRLYEKNRVRVLADVEYQPIELRPRRSPLTGEDLDMSLCFLRSASPIHVQYLKNMGVAATLVASLVVGDRLWGLVACHHYAPRFVHFEIRAACELLAESVATRIAALESFAQAQSELSVRRLEQRMVEAISREGDWRAALFDSPQPLLQPLAATGAALLLDGQVLTAGEVPGTMALRALGAWLDARPRQPVIATASLGLDAPEFEELRAVASGLIATPVSSSPGEYLVWFRPERIRTVTWGGNPFKPVVVGNSPQELSPRRSFAQWHQLVEGTSDPWTPADLTAARLIGDTLSDVVLQFRSVRMLIAQSQLEQVSRQVRVSGQPVIVSDAQGRILLSNDAFEQLLPEKPARLESLEDLPALFAEPAQVRRRLQDLLRGHRTWRGEVQLRGGRDQAMPLLVRADPVSAAPDRVLGFVLLFTDLTERKAAEVARRRFQNLVLERRRIGAERLDVRADLVYQELVAKVAENAQLAALEVTDGLDLSRMPGLLQSIQASALRTAGLLKHLVWHSSRTTRRPRN
jgi:light-regulated signal transduction histidine kinase (bacteriophytochrome)